MDGWMLWEWKGRSQRGGCGAVVGGAGEMGVVGMCLQFEDPSCEEEYNI
jgi:hypothetical protein